MIITIVTVVLLSVVTAENVTNDESVSLRFDVKPSEETGQLLEQLGDEDVNPEELGSYFEGDIMVDSEQAARQALEGVQLWEGGIVPYVIDANFTYTGLKIIYWAILKIQQKTCIRLRPKVDSDQDYIHLTNTKTGCWSNIGKQGGPQQVNLQEPSCLHWGTRGTTIHEIMHALGISHEHNRPDRDDFVQILYENVRPNRKHNFIKNQHFINQVMPYDYGSLMHYSMFAFTAKPLKFTLKPKVTDVLKRRKQHNFQMGQRIRMSQMDIMRLNKVYCASKRKGPVFAIWNSLTNAMFPVQ